MHFSFKKTTFGFDIVVVYVDDLNLVSTATYLKDKFEMKDLRDKILS
jgi:hypothetical protein